MSANAFVGNCRVEYSQSPDVSHVSGALPRGALGVETGRSTRRGDDAGPLSTEAALVQLLGQVNAAVAKGAKLALGGKCIAPEGSCTEPTVMTDTASGNPAFREELFGPAALFFRESDEEAPVASATDSDFGSGGSVFTKDIERVKRAASRIETGMIFVNNLDWADADQPLGGVKTSGHGRELGDLGIQKFVYKKLVRVSAAEAPAITATTPQSSKRTVGEAA